MSSLDDGRTYWRSLAELADTPEYRERLAREFPAGATAPPEGTSRRTFIQLLGASIGLAGATACSWPKEKIAPYARRPAGRTPGQPVSYATAMDLGGVAHGLLVTSYDGRPIKVEGNDYHPISGGRTDALAQAAVLELYDPDRSQAPVWNGDTYLTWDDVRQRLVQGHFAGVRGRNGRGLCVLAEASSSPSVADMRERLLAAYPEARWFEYEPISRDHEREGSRIAFGAPARPQFDFSRARVVACFDADPLLDHPAAVRYARDFTARRNPDGDWMARLYAVESGYSTTGAMADHRLALAPSSIGDALRSLAAELAHQGLPLPEGLGEALGGVGERPAFMAALARDLLAHRSQSIVMVGPRQPAELHALAIALNAALGNDSNTVNYTAEPDPDRPPHAVAIRTLCAAMAAGQVDTLLMLGGNPVYDAPVDLDFEQQLSKVGTRVHLSLFRNETSRRCTWHLPRAHFLEAWGDALAYDGTLCSVQPLIRPLYEGKSEIELLSLLCEQPDNDGYAIVRRTFLKGREQYPDFEANWRMLLEGGVLPGSAFRPQSPPLGHDAVRAALQASAAARQGSPGIEVVFARDAKVYDGRFANNGWLQELPDFITKLTWGNAALLAPRTARALGVATEDIVRIGLRGREVEVPVCVVPGHAPDCVTLALGYGRSAAGRVGDGVGANVYALRTSEAPDIDRGATVAGTGRKEALACTQDHHAIDTVGMQGRAHRLGDLVRGTDLADYREHPDFARHKVHHPPLKSLWQERESEGRRWGMAIDLNVCTGCNACVVACQAENNIPVVGREQVRRGREMHWLRIDRYFAGDPDAPAVAQQPVACVHCENAPCEQVCPVAATVHDSEGLNVMVYNRCVGTRYCSNNCPYKVRRFNFFNYHKNLAPTDEMVFNPEVTVRSRGVMEKCTYCVQRIQRAKIEAKNEQRPVRDGETVPACAQACPTDAIVFGDLNDPESRVSRMQEEPRSYAMLGELNVKPRTHYLARVTNPNEQLRGKSDGSHGDPAGH